MKLNKSQGDLLKRVIERWEADGTIDVSTADRLKGSYTVRSFEWKDFEPSGCPHPGAAEIGSDRRGVGVGGSFDHGFA